MGLATEERRALSDLFAEVGPDQPTLCAGWQTRDLAAHLVIRERRLDTAPGILVPALHGYTQKVQDRYAAKPWEELVALVRTGPGALSPFGIPALADQVNGAEFFVHHEDVRRAQPDWQPRPADAARDEALWRALGRVARLNFRRSPIGVVLRRPDGQTALAKSGPNPVAIQGEPAELVLYAFGRSAVHVELDGDETAIATLKGLKLGI